MNSILVENSFSHIVDPETNKNVPLESSVGRQIIENYMECLRNGPDSENILSTKMFYDEETNNADVIDIDISINNELEQDEIYEISKTLLQEQYTSEELKIKLNVAEKQDPLIGNKVWIRRSNGRWQKGLISAILLDETNVTKFNVYFKTSDDQIASKKNMDGDNILFYD